MDKAKYLFVGGGGWLLLENGDIILQIIGFSCLLLCAGGLIVYMFKKIK